MQVQREEGRKKLSHPTLAPRLAALRNAAPPIWSLEVCPHQLSFFLSASSFWLGTLQSQVWKDLSGGPAPPGHPKAAQSLSAWTTAPARTPLRLVQAMGLSH